jgi:hypothetical protein
MPVVRKPGVELKAYIHWNNRWHHVYIVSSFDQMNLLGAPVRMLEFRLTKKSKETLTAEKFKFHKKKPAARSQKRSDGA